MDESMSGKFAPLSQIYGDPVAAKYITMLKQIEREVGGTTSGTIGEYLLRNKPDIDAELLKKLKKKSDSAITPRDEGVKKGREVLAEFFNRDAISRHLVAYSALPLVSGSLQYGDPINLDADVTLYCTNKHMTADPNVIRWMADELTNLWYKKGLGTNNNTNQAQITVVHVNDIRATETHLLRETADLDNFAADIGTVMSGVPLFPGNEHQLSLNRKTIQQIKFDPFVTACINTRLRECLETRNSRRIRS